METTVGKLKIGAPLAMGRYSVSRDADPAPIVWLKGAPNSDFITEFAVDYLPFDAMERRIRADNTIIPGTQITQRVISCSSSTVTKRIGTNLRTNMTRHPFETMSMTDTGRPIKTTMGFCASSKSTKSKALRIMQGPEYVCRYTAVSAARISFRSFVRRAFVQERQKTSSKTNV